jgi:hypothetical protein
MIKQFEADKNPNKTITLLHAINWTVLWWGFLPGGHVASGHVTTDV